MVHHHAPGAPMHLAATDCLLIVKVKKPTKQPHGYASFSNKPFSLLIEAHCRIASHVQ